MRLLGASRLPVAAEGDVWRRATAAGMLACPPQAWWWALHGFYKGAGDRGRDLGRGAVVEGVPLFCPTLGASRTILPGRNNLPSMHVDVGFPCPGIGVCGNPLYVTQSPSCSATLACVPDAQIQS